MKSTNLYVMAGELWITLHLLVHLFQTAVIRLGRCLSAPHSDIFRIKLISQTGGGNYRSEWKALTNKTSTMQGGKTFGAFSYTCSTDLPPGEWVCTILNFPPVWLSWKHFSSLRAYLFIDHPKGGLHHSWRVTNIYYYLVFFTLRKLQFGEMMLILTTLPISLY